MAHFVAGGALDPVKDKESLLECRQFKDIVSHIEKESLYIPLCSARQTGKTTLLYHLRYELQKMGYGIFYIDLSNLRRLDEARFYQTICEDIENQLQKCFSDESFNQPIIENIIDQPSLLDYLESVANRSHSCRKIIIMLDEVGGVPQEFDGTFWAGIRSIYTQGGIFRKFMFIFSGSLDINHLATTNTSPLFNVCCSTVSLEDFSLNQVKRLISGKLKNEELILPHIYKWTSGHPYLTQKLCKTIEKNDRYGDEKDHAAYITNLVEETFLKCDDSNLVYIFNHLMDNKKYVGLTKKILEGQRIRRSFRSREIEIIGLIVVNQYGIYQIRNRIYNEALIRYFEGFEEDY